MKKLSVLFVVFLISLFVFSQTPQKISYQAIVRDANNHLISNTQIGLEINILKGSPTGTVVYTETLAPTTNLNGLFSIQFGGGTEFNLIDWGSDSYFIQTKVDITGGTNYTIEGVSQILSVPYAFHAETAKNVTDISNITSVISDSINVICDNVYNSIADTANALRTYVDNAVSGSSSTYSIGDFAHGGIVFWVDETGQHGLVCAKNDVDDPLTVPTVETIKWHNNTTVATAPITRAKSSGPLSGKMNTYLIVSRSTAAGVTENYAAVLCSETPITEGGVTYGDWYLPSKDELLLMYANKSAINATAVANGGSALQNNTYWSSTEASQTNAIKVNMSTGFVGSVIKTDFAYVRAVRAF
ncbi:MAG: DUF1566 domain-containing protein [Ignavibacteria bacterium]|nr:DUF1566 domain-containing protein [Ignavibacteria bacterium]